MRPPGGGDRRKEVAVAAEVAGQPTVAAGVESCETEHLPRTFPTIQAGSFSASANQNAVTQPDGSMRYWRGQSLLREGM